MPVGKNALKRVSNNGYSKVQTTAPDMENSEVEAVKEEAKAPEVKECSVKTEAKKNTTPKTKKPATPKPKMAKAEARPDGFKRYGFGDELPVHLL